MQQAADFEEDTNIDESVWIPKGEEVIPSIQFLNNRVSANGTSFMSLDVSLADRLLHAGRIDAGQHHTAVRINRLACQALRKQDYTVSKVFSPTPLGGFDNAEFCPLTLFLRITRGLNTQNTFWVRVLCGLRSCTFEQASFYIDRVKDALDAVEKKFDELRVGDDERHYSEGPL